MCSAPRARRVGASPPVSPTSALDGDRRVARTRPEPRAVVEELQANGGGAASAKLRPGTNDEAAARARPRRGRHQLGGGDRHHARRTLRCSPARSSSRWRTGCATRRPRVPRRHSARRLRSPSRCRPPPPTLGSSPRSSTSPPTRWPSSTRRSRATSSSAATTTTLAARCVELAHAIAEPAGVRRRVARQRRRASRRSPPCSSR